MTQQTKLCTCCSCLCALIEGNKMFDGLTLCDLPPMAVKALLPTWAIKGGRVKRPFEPKEAGSRAMTETAKGMVFCEDIISAAIASLGGNLNSLHKIS